MAFLSCLSWYIADVATNHLYSNDLIPFWNAFVRLAFFLITALRTNLRIQLDLTRTDVLTGLYGRREFNDRLKHELALAQRHKSVLSFAYVDVDNFKSINDTYGHSGGDRVLQLIADSFKKSLRMTDTSARLGGDEFALILPDANGDKAREILARFEREFRSINELSDWGISCSIGVVTLSDSAVSPEQVLAAADQLMYKTKRNGKGAVAYGTFGEVS